MFIKKTISKIAKVLNEQEVESNIKTGWLKPSMKVIANEEDKGLVDIDAIDFPNTVEK